jgi:hypothetical protein
MFPYLLFTICFFFSATFSHSHMMKSSSDTYYGLICPDESLAVAKGLHACCENPPFVYCVLCVLLSKPEDHIISTCTTDCNGTLLQEPPYCVDCVCNTAVSFYEAEAEAESSTEEKYRGCPFLNRKGKHKNDL